MDNTPTTSPLPNIALDQIGPALRIFLGGAVHRGELAALELAHISHQATLTLLVMLTAVGLLLLGGFTITFTIASMVWDLPERTMILGLVALAYLLGGGVMVGVVAARIKKWHPFAETRRQFHNDHLCLEELLTSGPDQPTNKNARR